MIWYILGLLIFLLALGIPIGFGLMIAIGRQPRPICQAAAVAPGSRNGVFFR